jgi:hypothetical protein
VRSFVLLPAPRGMNNAGKLHSLVTRYALPCLQYLQRSHPCKHATLKGAIVAFERPRRVVNASPRDICAWKQRTKKCLSSMELISSPSLPFTFAPALHEDWEDRVDPLVLPSSANSDDFEGLHLIQEETIARKNKDGVVIQHRAWPLGEAFRSEADYPAGELFLEIKGQITEFIPRNTTSITTETSNPAIFTPKSQNGIFSNRVS